MLFTGKTKHGDVFLFYKTVKIGNGEDFSVIVGDFNGENATVFFLCNKTGPCINVGGIKRRGKIGYTSALRNRIFKKIVGVYTESKIRKGKKQTAVTYAVGV